MKVSRTPLAASEETGREIAAAAFAAVEEWLADHPSASVSEELNVFVRARLRAFRDEYGFYGPVVEVVDSPKRLFRDEYDYITECHYVSILFPLCS